MPDFGEVLVDIRDHFADPLPSRVKPVHVFTAVMLESLGAMLLKAWGYRSPIRVPNFEADITSIQHHFEGLRDLPCTRDQIDQAQDLLHNTLARFQTRIHREYELWFAAAQAGAFLGTLIIILLLASAMMCLLTHRLVGDSICLSLVIAIEGIAGIACVQHWHYYP